MTTLRSGNVTIETNDRENGCEKFCPEETFEHLRPSKDILEFYRNQIKSLEDDNIATVKKLEGFRTLCDDYHKALISISNHESEINKLQKALSDLQECLFREKELTAKLKLEKQTLKSNIPPVNKFSKERVISHRLCKQKENLHISSDISKNDIKSDHATLSNEMESLKRQLIDCSSASWERMEKIIQENKRRCDQLEELRREDGEKMSTLTNKLKRAQDMLYESTKELLEVREAHREEGLKWIEEKEKLLKEAKFARKDAANISRQTLNTVEQKMRDSEKVTNHLRHQVQRLETELSSSIENSEATKKQLEKQLKETTECLLLLTKRYKDLEVRRKLEIEGYRRDISHLKTKLESTEEQLYKVALSYSTDFRFCNEDDNDNNDGDDDNDGNNDSGHFGKVKKDELRLPRKVSKLKSLSRGKRLTKSHKSTF